VLKRFNRSTGGSPTRLSHTTNVFNQRVTLTSEDQARLRQDRAALEVQANRLYPVRAEVIDSKPVDDVNTTSTEGSDTR
jgi:hypothetical protein